MFKWGAAHPLAADAASLPRVAFGERLAGASRVFSVLPRVCEANSFAKRGRGRLAAKPRGGAPAPHETVPPSSSGEARRGAELVPPALGEYRRNFGRAVLRVVILVFGLALAA